MVGRDGTGGRFDGGPSTGRGGGGGGKLGGGWEGQFWSINLGETLISSKESSLDGGEGGGDTGGSGPLGGLKVGSGKLWFIWLFVFGWLELFST
jgi:hypothetical protein